MSGAIAAFRHRPVRYYVQTGTHRKSVYKTRYRSVAYLVAAWTWLWTVDDVVITDRGEP